MSIAAILLTALTVGQSEPKATDQKCGAYCLYVCLRGLDFAVPSFDEFEKRLGSPSPRGYSLGKLEEVAQGYGASTLGVETSLENLSRRSGRFACIVRIGSDHFVIVAEANAQQTRIIDPPDEYWMPRDTLGQAWSGEALLISNRPLLAEEELPRPFPWRRAAIIGVGVSILGFACVLWRRARAANR